MHALISRALTGDVEAIREIANRTDGKPHQQIEIGGDPESFPRVQIYLPDNGRGARSGEPVAEFRSRTAKED